MKQFYGVGPMIDFCRSIYMKCHHRLTVNFSLNAEFLLGQSLMDLI